MTAGYTQTDVLTRVRREQRMRGKPSDYSGLRILITATAITVAILLFAFGAIGMLLLARSPQEPIVSKLDTAPYLPPVAQQVEVQPALQTELDLTPKQDLETKSVRTLRVIAPPANDVVVQQQVPSTEPETTATIPPSTTQLPARSQQQVPQRVNQQPQRQQQAVRREIPKSQADNPLYQLFGIKQYR